MHDNSELFVRSFDALDDGMVIFDDCGSIIYHNFRAAEALEHAGINLSGCDIIALAQHFGITGFTSDYRELRTDYLRDGRTFHIVLKRIFLEDSTAVLLHIAESSSRERQVNRIYRYNSEILCSIKNRVTGVRNALSYLIDYDAEQMKPEQLTLLQDCRCEIWRLSRYAENVADMSLIQAGELRFRLNLERADLRSIVNDACGEVALHLDTMKLALATGINIGDTPLPVVCDIRRLQRVIESLLLNAAMYAGDRPQISIECTVQNTDVRLLVADTGSGLSKADRSKVFHYPFRGRDAARKESTGLGLELFISRHIISALKGDISMLDSPQGAVFEIVIPLAQ